MKAEILENVVDLYGATGLEFSSATAHQHSYPDEMIYFLEFLMLYCGFKWLF